jgi:hypothetical protein
MSALATELSTIDLGDRRLNRRAGQLGETLATQPTLSIPAACGGWDETRAAYRFFDHAAVSAEAVLAPHITCTEQRLRAHSRVLCIEDTTELDYTKRKASMAGLGVLNYETRWGIYLHPTLAVTPEGVPLGVLGWHSFIREPGTLGEEKAAHRPLEEKESVRWVDGFARVNELAETLSETRLTYIADREGDLYELFVEAPCPEHSADWLVRGQHHDRRLSDGRTLIEALEAAPVLTEISFERPAAKGRPARAVTQQLKAVCVTLKPPYRPERKLPEVTITALLARESDPPPGEEPIEWLLLSNLPVETPEQAIEKLTWYLCRWQIEIYFKVLKSGCRVEELQLETRERLEPALALYMIIAWRVLYLTKLGRNCPEMPCNAVFAEEEWRAVYLVTQRRAPPEQSPSLDTMVRMLATLGGFLNRKSDGFPGPKTIWIGLQRTADFVLALRAQRSADGRYG